MPEMSETQNTPPNSMETLEQKEMAADLLASEMTADQTQEKLESTEEELKEATKSSAAVWQILCVILAIVIAGMGYWVWQLYAQIENMKQQQDLNLIDLQRFSQELNNQILINQNLQAAQDYLANFPNMMTEAASDTANLATGAAMATMEELVNQPVMTELPDAVGIELPLTQ